MGGLVLQAYRAGLVGCAGGRRDVQAGLVDCAGGEVVRRAWWVARAARWSGEMAWRVFHTALNFSCYWRIAIDKQ